MEKFEALDLKEEDYNVMQPSIVEPPKMEQKPLPTHLKYAYLGLNDILPWIISSSVSI